MVSNLEDPREITATALHPGISVAFVGKEDGGVRLYDLIGGRKIQDLVALQSGRAITHLAFGNMDMLACGDSTGAVAVKVVVTLRARSTENDTINIGKLQWLDPPPAEPNTAVPIVQLVFTKSVRGLVVSNRETTQIWILREDETMELTSSGASPADLCWRFTPCDDNQDQFQLVDKPKETVIHPKGNGGNDPRVGPGLGSQATGKPKRSNTDDSASSAQSKNGSSRVRRVHTDPDTGYVVVEYAGAKATTQLVILERTSPAPLCRNTSGRIRSACSFGVWNGKGPSTWARSCGSGRWTCATSRTGPNPAGRKHFFIPHEKYLGGNDNVQARVGNKDEVIFPRRGELAVVWGGIGRSTG